MDFPLSLDYQSNAGPMSLDELQPHFAYLDHLPNDGLMSLDESQPQFAYLETHPAPSNSPTQTMQMDMHTTVEQSFGAESTPNTSMGPLTKMRKRKAPTLRAEAWEPLKSRILDLHITQKLPLPTVKKRIEGEFQFTAELRQYRTRISQWGLDKNIKPVEMKAIVRKRQQRRLVEDKGDLRFTVRGTTVEPQKIERWMKRNAVPESCLYATSPAASTPSDVGCRTISEIGSPIATPSYLAVSPYSLPRSPKTVAQNPTPTAFFSPTLSIASLIQHQFSSFAEQSPSPIYQSLSNANTIVVPFSLGEPIPLFANLPATVSSDIRYRESDERLMYMELSVLQRTYGINDQRTLSYSFELSVIFREQGRFRAAETMVLRHLEALRKQKSYDGVEAEAVIHLLGTILGDQGLYAEAGRLFERAFEFRKRMLGDDHRDTLASMRSLAWTYRHRNLNKEAEKLVIQVFNIQKRVLGERDPETLTSMETLALIYLDNGQLQEAEWLVLQTIKGRNSVLGPMHPSTLINIGYLALVHIRQGRFEEAVEALEKVTGTLKEVLGKLHPNTLSTMSNLARAWKGQGYGTRALLMMESCSEMEKEVLGPQHPNTLSSLASLHEWGTHM